MASNTDSTVFTEQDYKDYKQILLKNLVRFAPHHIAEKLGESNVQVYPSKKGELIFAVTIRKGKYKGDAGSPDARAQEYGSGLYTTSKLNFPPTPGQRALGNGNKGRYLIKPKKGAWLAFKWEAADKESLHWSRVAHWQKMKKEGTIISEVGLPSYAGELPDGKLAFNWVKHPGIKPYVGRGYIKFSVEVSKAQIEEQINYDASNFLKTRIREIFSRPGGINK